MISKELKEDLIKEKMLEDDICLSFVGRQFSIFSRILSPIIRVVKNRSKEQYLSLANETLHVFYAKGFFTPKQVDKTSLQKIKLSAITDIIKKDVPLNGIRAQKFTITYNDGSLKGFIVKIKGREVLRKIEEKIAK